VAKLGMTDQGYTVTTVAGAKANFPFKSFTRWDFSKGKLTYLSDLEPRPTESSNVNFIEHYRRDKNLDGEPIRLPQKNEDGVPALHLFPKGLSMHAYTELQYDIGGEYKEFKAILGVDPKVQGDSRVKITIEGDGKELFNAEISRKDEPRPITLDVRNVKLLRIVVASTGLLDLGNHVCLADAKVSK
jgi:NPCBM/NEW2 domain